MYHRITPRFPSLYQINTRAALRSLRDELGRHVTLDDIPESWLDEWAGLGFDWIWLLGAWQSSQEGRRIALGSSSQIAEYSRILPDLREEDVCGSCFAISAYHVDGSLGDDHSLKNFRDRLHQRGFLLMMDFVPNHVALDHPWVKEHPEYFISGDERNLVNEPSNYIKVSTAPPNSRASILAHGRDPNFPGWNDTLQLNFANPELQEAMIAELLRIASLCDGVRCDMAMLLTPLVFEHTWGLHMEPFWPHAIERVRETNPEFTFMAEVYWDMEADLLNQGFDIAYDKRLLDKLHSGDGRSVQAHFRSFLAYQSHLARFLENHDEARAAASFPWDAHQAAALVTYLSPGLRFFHQGQLQGKRTRLPVQLCRYPPEAVDRQIVAFYTQLLTVLQNQVFRQGNWQLLDVLPTTTGFLRLSRSGAAGVIAYAWSGPDEGRFLVLVNFKPEGARFTLTLPWNGISGAHRELMTSDESQPHTLELASRKLHLELPPWGYRLIQFL